jgi:eukaryotic-like serine/threonine-protein kinase
MVDPIAAARSALGGRYEIERELGQGAYATVYLARDRKHDRPVAIKVLNANQEDTRGEPRFIREIALLARLKHPNILPLYDWGHVEALVYYTMPYVRGETLRERLRTESRLTIDVACNIAREIADALAYAHGEGVVHRDIKPENILLSEGQVVVADFGVAWAIDLAGMQQLTHTGEGAPGTAAYMSPEQLLKQGTPDGRSDIYSLGCVLYEMVTGTEPFPGKRGFVKRFTGPTPVASQAREDVPPWLDDALSRALAPNREDRFGHARDLAELLSPTHGRPR